MDYHKVMQLGLMPLSHARPRAGDAEQSRIDDGSAKAAESAAPQADAATPESVLEPRNSATGS